MHKKVQNTSTVQAYKPCVEIRTPDIIHVYVSLVRNALLARKKCRNADKNTIVSSGKMEINLTDD
jgi:hypothetical protein